jgi:ABC-2 type transport system permease protein
VQIPARHHDARHAADRLLGALHRDLDDRQGIPSQRAGAGTGHDLRRRSHQAIWTPHRIPLTRIVGVELRKSFDTRSGSWLLAGIGIAAVVTTGAVIAWAPESEFSYGQFTLATGFPMSVILPIIALLSIIGEWSQRSGLATFTLVPRRGRVLLGKAIGAAIVAAAATVVTFAVGAIGNVVGSSLAGTPAVWDLDMADVGRFTLGTLLMVFVGFGIGALVRNSPGAIVA